MAKEPSTQYVCQECGFRSPKWLGRCPGCSQWNSLLEEKIDAQHPAQLLPAATVEAEPLDGRTAGQGPRRLSTGIDELDRVLGGGVVAGSVVLIGGEPGIGKSTLLLQALHGVSTGGKTLLYASGEESADQIRLRSRRVGISSPWLYVVADSLLENILGLTEKLDPDVLAIDSVQTVYSNQLESAPGSVSQVRHCASRVILEAKKANRPTFLVGHVTKEGAIAGPRVLEHMVDTVLYFEGDRGHSFRILRAIKNRYGSTNEIGVFEMSEKGLCQVMNPSELFLAERPLGVAGSAITAAIEGSRPLLVEVQALVSPSSLAIPRRTTMGVDHNRLALLLAVLEKKVGYSLAQQDIFVNAAGGVRVDEPAVDLAIAAAVASSFLEKPIDPGTVVLGEIGLTGEVRGVSRVAIRVKEAARLGFSRCLVPRGSAEGLQDVADMEIRGTASLQDALRELFDEESPPDY
ncbi:MAG: DNA repair protein RadA [Deltaproteobacteria bacterium]|nr:DNA repair protein RadA [Deltaproteobacteria bacterium]